MSLKVAAVPLYPIRFSIAQFRGSLMLEIKTQIEYSQLTGMILH